MDPHRFDRPGFAPALQGGELLIGATEGAGVFDVQGDMFPAQNQFTDLMFLRSQFPYLPIMPFPNRSISVVLSANKAVDIRIPSGTSLIMFKGNGDFYVSDKGNAELPDQAGNANASQSDATNTAASIYKPENALWYTSGRSSLSLISPSDNVVVSMLCYFTENWPRSDR